MNDDIVSAAAQVIRDSEGKTEEAEQFLCDVADVIARQVYFFSEATKAGLPRDIAKESTIGLSDTYFAQRWIGYFRKHR